MENQHLLLLQYLIATFEGQEEFAALTNEADRLILLAVNGSEISKRSQPGDDIREATGVLPEKLAQLAAAEPTGYCYGCGTPNHPQDEGNNCEICGYPGHV